MTITQPLISVVMPSLNQAGFIDAAVRSVLEQDYQALELVVLDGGSTDGTLKRLEVLSAIFGARLRWLSENDSGPANAINKALSLSRGEIIGWLNSDDLYTPGAVRAAAQHFAANPNVVMLYGEGEHIDSLDKSLGRYPTRPPSVSIQGFQDGCFICQPTVFVRREVFNEVGYLDESLATAFDLELWLRIFRRYPSQIVHVDRVQACSRLHADCITQKLRRLVAVEGVKVLAKHIGAPRLHWLMTYLEEVYAVYPFGTDIGDLKLHIAELVEQVKDCFDERSLDSFAREVARDMRLRIASPGVFTNIFADGWAPPVLELRIRKLPDRSSSIRIQCDRHASSGAPLSLRINTSWGCEYQVFVKERGLFEIVIDCSRVFDRENLVISVASGTTFIPKKINPESSDGRHLSFRVCEVRLLASSWDM